MERTHQAYAPKYRRRIIELARDGHRINYLRREFESTVETILKIKG
jgi:hypothetical protein